MWRREKILCDLIDFSGGIPRVPWVKRDFRNSTGKLLIVSVGKCVLTFNSWMSGTCLHLSQFQKESQEFRCLMSKMGAVLSPQRLHRVRTHVGVSIDFYPHGEGKFSSNKNRVSSARVLSIRILWKDKKLGSCWNGAQSSGLETARVLLPVREAWLLPTLARTVYGRQHPRILACLQSLSGTECDIDAVSHFPFHSVDK